MPKTEKELIARDATRDIGAELLLAVKHRMSNCLDTE